MSHVIVGTAEHAEATTDGLSELTAGDMFAFVKDAAKYISKRNVDLPVTVSVKIPRFATDFTVDFDVVKQKQLVARLGERYRQRVADI